MINIQKTKYKAYPEYKESEIQWVEKSPRNWSITNLKTILGENKRKNKKMLENNLLSLSYGKLKRKNIDTASGLVPDSFDTYQILEEGYIVLRFTDLQNDQRSLRVGYVTEHGIITSAYIGLKPKLEVKTKYYYYLLHHLDLIKYYYNLGGGVRQSLSFAEFGKEKILLPPPDEQKQIADFLDAKCDQIDSLIEENEKLLLLLDEKKQVIINDAVTGKVEVKCKTDQNGKSIYKVIPRPASAMKEAQIDWHEKIPKEWKVRKLKYVAIATPSNVDKKSIDKQQPVLLCNYVDVYKNDFITESLSFMEATASHAEIKKFQLNIDDVIITKDSETAIDIAEPAYVKYECDNLICGYHLTLIRTIKSKLLGSYLFRLFKVPHWHDQFKVSAKGVTRVGLGANYVKNAKILMPTIKEQQLIVAFLLQETKKINKEKAQIKKEIELMKEYQTVLISEAVTGKIDVRSKL